MPDAGGTILGSIPSSSTLIGRVKEQLLLSHMRADHLNGQGGLLAIEGHAGMGKTALLAHHAHASASEGAHIVWARATQIDQIRPFGCLIDALDCRLHHSDASRRRVAEAVVSVNDAIIDPFRFDSGLAWRFPVQEAICDLICELADHAPTMLVIDDAQWADAGTHGVMLALARRCVSSPIVIAWTLRSAYIVEALQQVIGRYNDSLVRFELEPLATVDARELGVSLLGRPLSREGDARVDRAEGNPFFITALAAQDGEANSPAAAVLSWVAQLNRATADLLCVASVLGTTFDLSLLASMTDQSFEELVTTLEPAVLSGLVRASSDGRFAFGHDLIRDTIEDDLADSLRRALHRDAARVQATLGCDSGIVARHLAWGAQFGDESSAEQIRLACLNIVRHDADGAAELLSTAISLCIPGSAVWATSTANRVVALQWAGHAAQALQVSTEAMQQPMSKDSEAELRMVRATSLALVNDLPAAAVEYRILAEDPALAIGFRALVLAELSILEAWGVDRTLARSHADRAIEMARSAGSLQPELQALCSLSTMSLFDGHVHDAVGFARQAVTLGRTFRGLTPAREVYLALALANADDNTEASIWLSSGQAAAEAVADLWLVSRYQLARISMGLNSGDWDRTIADANAVISVTSDSGMATGMPQAPASAGIIAVRRGAPDDDVSYYRDLALSTATAGAEPAGMLCFGWFESLIAERNGAYDIAAATLQYVTDAVVDSAPLIRLWIGADHVRILLAMGHVEAADTVARALTMVAARARVGSALGAARLCEALVLEARNDPLAVPMLREAAGHLRSARRLPLLLHALERLAPIDSNRDLHREGLSLRQQLAIVDPTHPFLEPASAFGREIRQVDQKHNYNNSERLRQLTPMERTVAELVSQGLSNSEIAATLNVSKRTIEFHMSHLYSKLAISTRTAVAALMRKTSL